MIQNGSFGDEKGGSTLVIFKKKHLEFGAITLIFYSYYEYLKEWRRE
jgi:hypothetical protein